MTQDVAIVVFRGKTEGSGAFNVINDDMFFNGKRADKDYDSDEINCLD